MLSVVQQAGQKSPLVLPAFIIGLYLQLRPLQTQS
nr:unnamed protein product [Callosobruchus analis]